MRLTVLGLLAAFTMMLAVNARADIVVGGSFADWTDYKGSRNSGWNQDRAESERRSDDYRFFDDPDGDADGGQRYDIEQLFYFYDDEDETALTGGTLYFGLVSGYSDRDYYYDSGDFFIDLGGEGTYDIAIATDSSSSESDRYGRAWVNDGWDETDVILFSRPDAADPYRIDEDANTPEIGFGEYAGLETQIDWGYGAGRGDDHNFLEFSIDLNGYLESLMAGRGIGMHWTMECGNDYINACDSDPLTPMPNDPPVVPLPASVILGGIGMLGVALRRRKQVC